MGGVEILAGLSWTVWQSFGVFLCCIGIYGLYKFHCGKSIIDSALHKVHLVYKGTEAAYKLQQKEQKHIPKITAQQTQSLSLVLHSHLYSQTPSTHTRHPPS